MTDSKRKYKEKIVRKYIEIYPSESAIIEFIYFLNATGYPFQRFAKDAIKRYIKEIKGNGNRNF